MTKNKFRNYDHSSAKVKETYRLMQENQTLLFVKQAKRKYAANNGYTDKNGNKIRKRLVDVFSILDTIIDESDPDAAFPQIYHAYQTGEALRKRCLQENGRDLQEIAIQSLFSTEHWHSLPGEIREQLTGNVAGLYPHIHDWSWLPLIGFIHDLGKVLAAKDWGELPQWAVVGDTFPVGAPFSASNVYSQCLFYQSNADLSKRVEQPGKWGIYDQHCGFDNVQMSWGHDEYCYSVLKRTIHHLPDEALKIIRYHSFYAWHTPSSHSPGYMELANEKDYLLLPLLKLFQKCDLYSKANDLPDVKQLANQYRSLLTTFIPGRQETHYDLRPAKLLW